MIVCGSKFSGGFDAQADKTSQDDRDGIFAMKRIHVD